MSRRLRSVAIAVLLSGALTGAAAQDLGAAPGLSSMPFPLRDLRGREWSRTDLEGKVVLVDFWATWCTPCVGELPHLRRAYDRHRDSGFEILAVSLEQTERAALRRWLRARAIPWPQMHDNRGLAGDLARAFAVELVPRSFLFDRSGRLVAVDLRGEAFEAAVAALVDSSAAAAPAERVDGPGSGGGVH